MKTIFFLSTLLSYVLAFGQSNAELGECTGTIFKMPGMSNSDKALLLTNAHCLPIQFPTNKPSSATKELTLTQSFEKSFLYNSQFDLGNTFSTQRFIYATMSFRDVAIIELTRTYEDLTRLKYQVFEIAETPPKSGEALAFHSFYKQSESLCQIEGSVPVLREAVFTLKNVLRLKQDSKCQMEHGHSGTAGIKEQKIYALVFTRYDGTDKPCALNNPCEVSKASTKTAEVGQVYAFPTHFLHRCYNPTSRSFDFNLKACKEGL